MMPGARIGVDSDVKKSDSRRFLAANGQPNLVVDSTVDEDSFLDSNAAMQKRWQ